MPAAPDPTTTTSASRSQHEAGRRAGRAASSRRRPFTCQFARGRRRRRRRVDHGLRRPGGPGAATSGRDVHLVDPVAQAAQQGRGRGHLHEPAHRAGVDRLPAHRRVGLAQLVQHAGLGGHQHGGRRGACGRRPACRRWTAPGCGRRAGRPRPPATAPRSSSRTPGWMNSSALGLGGRLAAQVGRADAGVHVALAQPDVHVVAAGDPLDVGAEELVGQEQDLPVAPGATPRSRAALAEVQHTSDSALTSALVLT